MVWYVEHQVKGRTSGAQESIRNIYGSRILRNTYGEVANFFNQDTAIIGLPDGCVGHDIHLTGYRETNIIVLGEMFQPIISAWDSDLVGVRIFQTHRVQEEKWKFATQIDEMTLRDSREMNYDSKLQNMSWFCYKHVKHVVPDKHAHMVVLQ